MKKFVLLLVIVFAATAIFGCGKRKKDEAVMDGLSGVTSENVVFLNDEQSYAESVPVLVENAENVATNAQSETEMIPGVEAQTTGKPTSKQIQFALKNAGFYNGKVDGEIGPRTKKAIEAFQAQNGLKADGKVGVRTWRMLSTYLNQTPEVENPSADIQAIGQ